MKTNSEARIVLLRENYYSIINGYKDPFLDKKAMESCASDMFLAGTEFNWLYALFMFDRELRQTTFSYLIQAEAALKTATVYSFCDAHRGATDYLDRRSFANAKDMLVPKSFRGDKERFHSENLNRLMDILASKLSPTTPKRPFIAHYLNAYKEVPLWVLANDLTFGNMVKLLEIALLKKSVEAMKNDIDKLLDKYSSSLHILTRNDLQKQLGM